MLNQITFSQNLHGNMKIYKNLKIKESHKNSVIEIVNFDGIHLGHQKVINQAKKKQRYTTCLSD